MRKKKLKKVITTALLAGFITMNIAPVFAIDEVKKSSATPKEFKSYVKKNKKTSDDYKYNYINKPYRSLTNRKVDVIIEFSGAKR